MKKLSLLMLTILSLGCDTDTMLVEEPEPIIEEPPPVLIEEELSHHPLIAHGTVKNGQVNVDPGLLNSSGFFFHFKQDFLSYSGAWLEKNGKYLNSWNIVSASHNAVHIWRMADFDLLEYDTEYQLAIYARDSDCESIPIVIHFRTKPQKPVVGRPTPVIQERILVLPLGERFRFDKSIRRSWMATSLRETITSTLNRLMKMEFNLNLIKISIGIRLTSGVRMARRSVGYLVV